MINAQEFRLGNHLMHKTGVRILTVSCTFAHFELMKNGTKDFFPVVLNADVLQRCGFTENKDYALLPDAREFRLVLPVIGGQQSEIMAYVKNNKECFGRATTNGVPVSNNFYQLHQLQNLYWSLTGRELDIS